LAFGIIAEVIGIHDLDLIRAPSPQGESYALRIKITREGATPEQKARLIRGVTVLPADILDKDP